MIAEFSQYLFSASYMPHGHCFLWSRDILLVHVISDAVIALSYYSIPIALVAIVRQRKDLAYNGVVLLFAAFIFLCGTTHIFDIVTIWTAAYPLQGVVKGATAIVSLVCAAALWPQIPKIVSLPSAEELKNEVQRRQRIQEEILSSNSALTADIQQRTRELVEAYRELKRFSTMVNFSHDAIVALKHDGTVASWNYAAEKLFDVKSSDVIGERVTRIIPGELHLHWQDLVEKVVRGEEAQPIEIAVKDGGRARFASISLSPLIGAQGTLDGLFLIGRDISERKASENQLAQSLHEKELLLKEIHHRVKNNMQVISSLLKLQASYVTDKETKAMFQESEERVQSMALVHEKLYRSEGLTQVDFKSYVEELAFDLFHTYAVGQSKVELRTDIEELQLGIDRAVPCGLILNELISNSLKHAFDQDQRGELLVEMKRSGDGVRLTVSDDGKGLPPEIDLSRPRSLGLRVIITLCDQLRAELSVLRERGTTFTLDFRIDDEDDEPVEAKRNTARSETATT